jgi:hypothetical protein
MTDYTPEHVAEGTEFPQADPSRIAFDEQAFLAGSAIEGLRLALIAEMDQLHNVRGLERLTWNQTHYAEGQELRARMDVDEKIKLDITIRRV